MAQLVVRNLEDEVKERLRRRARRHDRSMEEEARAILRSVLAGEDGGGVPLGSRLAARFVGIGLDADIPELRGEAPRPADLDG